MSGAEGTSDQTGAVGPGRLRRHRDFVAFWSASTVSDLGSALTALALQVLVITDLGGTAADVGLVNGARWVAYLVLGLVAGLWIDRVRRRPVLVAADLGRFLVLGAVAAMALTHRLPLTGLIALIVVFGVLSLAGDAASQSFLPRLVPRSLLVRANVRLEQSTAVASTGGPAVAGALITAVGAPVAIALDAVSYLISGILLAWTGAREPTPEGTRRAWRAEIAEGLRYAYGHPTLGPMSINSHGWFTCWAVLGTVQVTFALTALGISPLALGLVTALGGVAALIGTSLAEPVSTRLGIGRTLVISRLAYAPGVMLVALAPAGGGVATLVPFALAQVIIGLAFGLEGPPELGFRQTVTPDALQGRVNATLRSANRSVIVVAAPLGGLLADRLGLRPTLGLTAAAFLLVGVWFARTPASTARLDEVE